MPPENISYEFSKLTGELAESFHLNKSVGQIYGLLYMTPEPLSLDDIAQRLSMSKGNASMNLKVLKFWRAVRSVWVDGTRKDYYEANRDLFVLASERLDEGLNRRLGLAEETIDRLLASKNLENSGHDQNSVKKRLKEIRSFLDKGRKALRLMPKVLQFFKN